MKSALQIGILLIVAASVLAFSSPHTRHINIAKIDPTVRSNATPLFIASSAIQASEEDDGDHDHPVTKLKRGINALRATMRAATGISLTAMYVSVAAFTSGCVRYSMAFVLARFPTWARYFFQPFLIMYYVPLYMLRTWTSPKKRQERRALHTEIMNDVKRGVLAADAALESGYWPFQVTENGVTATLPPELDDEGAAETESSL